MSIELIITLILGIITPFLGRIADALFPMKEQPSSINQSGYNNKVVIVNKNKAITRNINSNNTTIHNHYYNKNSTSSTSNDLGPFGALIIFIGFIVVLYIVFTKFIFALLSISELILVICTCLFLYKNRYKTYYTDNSVYHSFLIFLFFIISLHLALIFDFSPFTLLFTSAKQALVDNKVIDNIQITIFIIYYFISIIASTSTSICDTIRFYRKKNYYILSHPKAVLAFVLLSSLVFIIFIFI